MLSHSTEQGGELDGEGVLVSVCRGRHPVPLSDQLKQLVELHKVAEQAMKGLIVRLWPKEAMPGSYFGLVRRLVDACPWIEVVKRSVCIEGARRALARAKVHWGKMDAEKLVTDRPPLGK